MSRYRLGCDIGGTFTDFAVLDTISGELQTTKVLTTPDDPSCGVLQGLAVLTARNRALRGGIQHVLHATTLAINAVLERRGAPTGLLATKGFRDVLEMRRSRRSDVADIFGDPPPPLVARAQRLDIEERIWSDGRVLEPLDLDQAQGQIRRLLSAGIRSFAVCLLHSYENPAHERALGECIRALDPSAHVSLSSDVLPEAGEYERFSATAINAYVQPVIDRYLARLQAGMAEAGVGCPLLLMLSGGGLASVETARSYPVRLIESGAAAGVMAGEYFRQRLDLSSVMIFDMGGTTAKICIVQDGRIPITSEIEVGRAYRFKKGTGLPVNVPSVELLEIGAGGGSIAFLNETGSLQVGPRSASADPGPVCYGRGGTEPTVTDADLVLGYLDADTFLGGEMKLDRARAEAAIERAIAGPLGISAAEAAWGIHEIVCENMAGAAGVYMAEWGGDPSRIALVAFGGAGPVHAYNLARKLGVPRIVLPPHPGVLSAVGMLAAPAAFDQARSYRVPLKDTATERVKAAFAEMEASARTLLAGTVAQGAPVFHHVVEMCYLGQELALPVPVGERLDRDTLAESFNTAYALRFGHAYPDVAIGIVRLRVRAQIEGPGLELGEVAQAVAIPTAQRRQVYCPIRHAWTDYPVHARSTLPQGFRIAGPCLVEDTASTLLMGPDAEASVDALGIMTITVGAADHDGA
ncbi:MAG: hydantoinase/oxoprolinase family protein [Nevskiales bacterium]